MDISSTAYEWQWRVSTSAMMANTLHLRPERFGSQVLTVEPLATRLGARRPGQPASPILEYAYEFPIGIGFQAPERRAIDGTRHL